MKTTVNFTSFETMSERKSGKGRFTFIATISGAILGAAIDFVIGTPAVCFGMGLCYGLWTGAAIDGAIASKKELAL